MNEFTNGHLSLPIKQNYSKIGKYISNKLHHLIKNNTRNIHSSASQTNRKQSQQPKYHLNRNTIAIPEDKNQPNQITSAKLKEAQKDRKRKGTNIDHKDSKQNQNESSHNSIDLFGLKKYEYQSPSIGTYHLNYALIEKKVSNCDFSKSTPHFYNQKYKAHQNTVVSKDYPKGVTERQKGMLDIMRMTGRDQIKGNIRKQIENPHQSRFILHSNSSSEGCQTKVKCGVQINKMLPRSQLKLFFNETSSVEPCNFEVGMKRLNSGFTEFSKQSSRNPGLNGHKWQNSQNRMEVIRTQNKEYIALEYRYDIKESASKEDFCVEWSKQLPRANVGVVPSYMDKNVTSRMAISMANLKALEMNCTNMKHTDESKKNANLIRKRRNKQKMSHNVIYKENYVDGVDQF